jgi:hypothetical protein
VKDLNSTLTAAAAEARFARRITAALGESSRAVTPDIAERLKFAREQALQRAKQARPVPVVVPELAFAGAMGSARRGGGGWGLRFGALVPLVVLVAGLFGIQQYVSNSQISAAADVDAALLSDDVPPAAYSDPGFVEYLKGAK